VLGEEGDVKEVGGLGEVEGEKRLARAWHIYSITAGGTDRSG